MSEARAELRNAIIRAIAARGDVRAGVAALHDVLAIALASGAVSADAAERAARTIGDTLPPAARARYAEIHKAREARA